jgi:hypothetical protein
MSGRREFLTQLLLAGLLFLCYAYFLPRRVDWNQNGRMDLTLALVDQGTLAIDDYVSNTGDYAHFGDHYYSDKAPGVSFLGAPFYAAFRTLARMPGIGGWLRQVAAGTVQGKPSAQELAGLFPWRGYFALALYAATLGAVALPSALLGLLVYRMARELGNSAGWSALLAGVYGLGTTAFPYGSAFYGHMLAAACLFGAFWLVRPRAAGRGFGPARLVTAGFLLGYAIITEFPMVLPAGVIGLYVIARVWRRPVGARSLAPALWVIAGGVIPLALLAAYDMAIYGTPLPAGYAYSEQWQTEVNTGFMTLTAPSLARLWGITFSPFRGLFFNAPALLCALPGLVWLWRRREWRSIWLMLAGVIVLLFLFNASSVVWWGGFAVGPRYVAPAVPFLLVFVAAWLARSNAGRIVFLVTGLVSFFSIWAQTITSVQYYPPEMYKAPLFEYSLPLLLRGTFALNLGNTLGLEGWASLIPLGLGAAALCAGLVWVCRPKGRAHA